MLVDVVVVEAVGVYKVEFLFNSDLVVVEIPYELHTKLAYKLVSSAKLNAEEAAEDK